MDDTEKTALLVQIIEQKVWYKSLENFMENIHVVDTVAEFPPQSTTPWGNLILKILYVRREIKNNNFEVIKDIPETVLYEEGIKLDLLTSVLINYHFKLNEKVRFANNTLYFNLLSFHKELGHTECVSVVTNICLKILIRSKRNFYIENNPELAHQGLYFYYIGFLHLANGRYEEALRDLKYSIILRSSLATDACIVVASLLLDVHYRPKKHRRLIAYIELKKFVEDGDHAGFEGTLKKYGAVFEEAGLGEIVHRLSKNVSQQRLKKIKKVYSRIQSGTLASMGVESEAIGADADIAVFEDVDEQPLDIRMRVSDSELLIEKTKSLMRYSESEPLCYETVMKELESR